MTTDTTGSDIREIDTGTLPDRYARGWHCLGPVERLSATASRTPSRRSAPSWWCSPTRRATSRSWTGTAGTWAATCRRAPSRATRSPARSTTGAGAATASASWCPTPSARRGWPAPASWTTDVRNGLLFVWHDHEGNPPQPEVRIPDIAGVRQRRVDRLAVELDPDRGLQLPGDHRQRHRHGALLLHPLRSADVLQERLRGPHRLAVPAQRRPARHERPRHVIR